LPCSDAGRTQPPRAAFSAAISGAETAELRRWLLGAEGGRSRARGMRRRIEELAGDIPELLAAADVAVSAAVWEGQPIWLQEALAAGCPIVATDVGGTAAVVGDAAVLTPPGDAGALAAAVSGTIGWRLARRIENSEPQAEVVSQPA